MLSPLLRLTLLLALFVGAVLGIRDGLRQRVLLMEHRRLQPLVGEMPVEDQNRDKIHLVAIRTDDPLYFVWRVYLPAEQTYHWISDSSPVGSWGSWTQERHDPEHSLVRCRVRQTDDGIATVRVGRCPTQAGFAAGGRLEKNGQHYVHGNHANRDARSLANNTTAHRPSPGIEAEPIPRAHAQTKRWAFRRASLQPD